MGRYEPDGAAKVFALGIGDAQTDKPFRRRRHGRIVAHNQLGGGIRKRHGVRWAGNPATRQVARDFHDVRDIGGLGGAVDGQGQVIRAAGGLDAAGGQLGSSDRRGRIQAEGIFDQVRYAVTGRTGAVGARANV